MADSRTRSLTALGTSKVLDLSADLQVFQAVNISLMSFFANMHLNGDLSRIVYASNAYAFRRRVEQNGKGTQGLNLPFMNLKLVNVEASSLRPWKNMSLEADGVEMYTIANKMRMTPVTLSYEGAFYFSTERETLFTMSNLIWERAMETKIPSGVDITYQPDPSIPAVTYTLDNIGILHMDQLAYNSEYDENAWLQKNKIRAIPVNPSVETWLFKPSVPIGTKISMTKEFIMSLYQNNDLNFIDNLVGSIDYIEGI